MASTASPRPSTHRSRTPTARMLLIAALVIGIPILEVWVLVQLGHAIGGLWTLALLVVEAMVGVWLLRREGARAWGALTDAARRGSLPVNEATDAALVLVGGVLLILPGLVTDLLGIIFLLPPTRPLARRLVQLLIARKVDLAGVSANVGAMRGRMNLDGQTIDGEVVDTPGARPDPVVRPQLTSDVVEGDVID